MPTLGGCLRLVLAINKRIKAPEANRMEVKLAGSILEKLKAARQSMELPAKASIARTVSIVIFNYELPLVRKHF